ncbi:hypothetical protein [Catellatospora citrea]|nr:hypothetical protein [Catellatospora citrea]RKE12058.1 hypothetical protein C8E86_6992 [Catellatospora citrea]
MSRSYQGLLACSLLLAAALSGCAVEAHAGPNFCAQAAPLAFGKGESLDHVEKLKIIRALSEEAPGDLRSDFDTLIGWYEHLGADHGNGEQQAKATKSASVTIGEFIERECDINLGGIRT